MARGENLHLQYAPADQGARLRRLLSKVRGLTLGNGYEGKFTAGLCSASLRIEPGDCLRVVHDVEGPPPPRQALETNSHLPGNVRFAATGGRMIVVADTRLDGEMHLTGSFREIGEGLCSALQRPGRPRPCRTKAITSANVQDALDKAGLEEGSVVRLDDGWELRPRIRGEAMAVRLTIERHDLRISRVVVTGCLSANERAVAFQALCFNARLRHARLACSGDTVAAETRLHTGLIDPTWLAHAARAVVTAAHHSRTTLEILASRTEVARHFERMFLDRNEHSTSLPRFHNCHPAQTEKGGD